MKGIKILAATLAIVSIVTLHAGQAFAAASTSITLSAPSSKTVGSTFTVAVRENSGTTKINLVTVVLTYDSSKIEFIGFDDGLSEFDYKGAQSGGSGTVSVKRGLYGGTFTGSHGVVGVTFRATSAGTANISVANGTRVTNPEAPSDNEWDGSKPSVSVAIANPASTPPPSTPPATSPTQQPVAPTNSTAPKKAAVASNTTASAAATTETTATPAPASEVKGETTTPEAKKTEEAKAPETKNASGTPLWFILILGVIGGLAGRLIAKKTAAKKAAAITAAAAAKKDSKKAAAKTTKK